MRASVLILAFMVVTGCTVDQRRHGVSSPALAPVEGERESGRALFDLSKPETQSAWKLYAIQGVKKSPSLAVSDNALRLTSKDAAGLFYFTATPLFEPRKEPLLAWRWRVSRLLPDATPLAPDLDNFPARLLVGFDSGWEGADAAALQWKKKVEDATGKTPPPRAICYTFGGGMASREAVDALFGQGRIVVINLRGRDSKPDTWYDEVRDVASEYRAIFNEDPPAVTAIAVASDTHRVHAEVVADFAEFRVFTGGAYSQFREQLEKPPQRELSNFALWIVTGAAATALIIAGLWMVRARGRVKDPKSPP